MGALLGFMLGATAGLFVWLATSAARTAPSRPRCAPDASRGLKPAPVDAQSSPMRGDMRGDVVWRQDHQDGWLTFRDLRSSPGPHLPAGHRREARGAPVDGGVFTIDGGVEETLVTIRPALIGIAESFVVTVEAAAAWLSPNKNTSSPRV